MRIKLLKKTAALLLIPLAGMLSQTASADWVHYHPTHCKTMEPEHERYLFYNTGAIQNRASFAIWVICPTIRPDSVETELFGMEARFQNAVPTSNTCGMVMTQTGSPWSTKGFSGASTPFASGHQTLLYGAGLRLVEDAGSWDSFSLYCALGPQASLLGYFFFDASMSVYQ